MTSYDYFKQIRPFPSHNNHLFFRYMCQSFFSRVPILCEVLQLAVRLVFIQRIMMNIEQLIIKALQTAHNNQIRQQAEAAIFQLLHNNPTEFFITCATIVAAEDKQETLRQSTASVMKAILSKKTQNGEFYWDLAAAQAKPQIKQMLLNNLISPVQSVMRAGANVIAQIAAIQIPRGQWLQLIHNLAQNTTHEQLGIRRASITTLGFMCEELKNAETSVDQQTCEQILGSLLLCLKQGASIAEISLTALRESVVFLRHILDNQNYCTQVFNFVLPIMGSADLKQKVYEFLFQFGRQCYHMLANFIASLAQITVQHINQRNQNSIRALEFWDTIGTEYLRRMEEGNERLFGNNSNIRNFIEESQDIILPHIMASILILSKDDLDFEDLREGAVKTLTTCVACCGRIFFDRVTDGVSRVLQSPNPGERQASALLFSCLVDYADKEYILRCFTNGFSHLYQLVQDKQQMVRKNTLKGFNTLAECLPEVFINNSDIYNIFEHLVKISTSTDEETQILALSILISVSDNFKDHPQCPVVIQPDSVLRNLIAIFTNNLTRNTNKQSNEKILSLIMNIIMATNKKSVVTMLLAHLIALYQQYSNINIQDKEIVLAQILALVHTTVLSMIKFAVDTEIRQNVYRLLDIHINRYGAEVQGIHLIGAVSLCFKKDFISQNFGKYWGIVMHGLEMIDQKPTFRSALNCIQDISRNNEYKIVGKLTPVFQRLITYMHNNIERQLKTEILRCFGDLTLGLKNYAECYVDQLLAICDQCFNAVERLSNIQSQKDYAQELKQALIEMYHCIVFAVNEQAGSINQLLANHFPFLCTFIIKTCDVKYSPTVEYVKNCLYLVFDAGLFYAKSRDHKQNVSQILNSREINNLITIIKKYKDKAGVADILAFIEDKLRNQRR